MSHSGDILAGNLFAGLEQERDAEEVCVLANLSGARIERIVSTGQASPPGFWYDQDATEWVFLVAGSAGLLFEGDAEPKVLAPGDYVEIPAHRRHRVAWTDPDRATVWLAVHLAPAGYAPK
ncbi:cupin domain-containing protein [uncultured Rhodoblastus sp.]|uniref:cupin domain-containing protein n=1 Tax=uncultured Rhodoblastus sp. TaxID=543037 RepID=UPI0025E78866|nr:cupin domain-containing protein [uncultured Rhodoblastus sp.]